MKLTRLTLLLTMLMAALVFAFPVAAQDATPEVTASPDLQTYTTPGGGASVQYPMGWVAEEGSDSDSILTVKLANSEAALAKELFNRDDVFESGEVHIEVAIIAFEELISNLPDSGLTPDSTPLEIIEALSEQGMPDEFTFGKPGEVTINDHPGVRMNIDADDRGEGQLLLTKLDKGLLGAIILYAAAGEGDKWDIVARDVLKSVEIKPVDEPASLSSATTRNNLGMLSYPDTWFSRQYGSDGIYVGNSQAAVDKSYGDAFSSGEVNILFNFTTPADFIEGAKLPLEPDATPVELLEMTIKAVGEGVTFSDVEETTIAGKPAARVDFSTSDFEGTAWAIAYSDDQLITLQLLTAPGETEQWQQTALDIAATAVFARQ